MRVYTIGFGTENGTHPASAGATRLAGVAAVAAAGSARGIDEETLKKIADMTGGEYYSATSASELQDVFQNLPTYLITKHEITEISCPFRGLGALVAALAISSR